ncbi:hypothetical protein LTR62_007799 [Meristemomyces frigidus]|uniref:intramembrane prenyl-peptidase Rce1 n=1 Tax=Meristemomyces frigidus TaxID=1508187 RepID=A0AAN7TBA7_9PEZI|nr:hypothetical protein LTR62_007799 [Meristemomyces frigidus]
MAPLPVAKIFDRIRKYYTGDQVLAPRISDRTALLCALAYTLLYIAPFYLSPTLRSTPLQSRNSPTVIRARIRAVAVTCLLSTAATAFILLHYGDTHLRRLLHLLGLWPVNALDILKVLTLVTILFLGPLYESLLVNSDWKSYSPAALKAALYDSYTGYRNLVIAPLTEELVFRSLTISLYLLANVEPARIVFTTPLIFGLAHVHHLVEFLQSCTPAGRRLPPLSAWVNGLARTGFQFGYTALFGFFAAFVYLRTGNLWACIVAHAFCNWRGLPRVWGTVGQHANRYEARMTPDVAQGKRGGENGDRFKVAAAQVVTADARPRTLGVGWSIVYYALLVIGAYAFDLLLWPLTASDNALARFEPHG